MERPGLGRHLQFEAERPWSVINYDKRHRNVKLRRLATAALSHLGQGEALKHCQVQQLAEMVEYETG